MSKVVKDMVTRDLQSRYAGASSACVIELTGLDVQQQQALRLGLRAKSGRLEVVKNSMARRAMKGSPLEPLGKALSGPCALVTSQESIVDIAKYLVTAAKTFKKLTLKKGIFEGDPDLLTVEQLSKMKGKRELVGEVAMLIASPGRALAGCLRSPQAKLAGCVKKLADRPEAA